MLGRYLFGNAGGTPRPALERPLQKGMRALAQQLLVGVKTDLETHTSAPTSRRGRLCVVSRASDGTLPADLWADLVRRR